MKGQDRLAMNFIVDPKNPSIQVFLLDLCYVIFHENCKLRIPAEHVVYTNCSFCFGLTFSTILVHNMFCGCCEVLKKIYLYKLRRLRYCVDWVRKMPIFSDV